jgi:hypothetical protein
VQTSVSSTILKRSAASLLFSGVIPAKAGIRYAAARWATGSPAFAGDDTVGRRNKNEMRSKVRKIGRIGRSPFAPAGPMSGERIHG